MARRAYLHWWHVTTIGTGLLHLGRHWHIRILSPGGAVVLAMGGLFILVEEGHMCARRECINTLFGLKVVPPSIS